MLCRKLCNTNFITDIRCFDDKSLNSFSSMWSLIIHHWSVIIPCTDTFNHQHFQDNHDYHPNHLWRCCTHFSKCELANNCKIQAKLYHDGEDYGEGYCVVIIGKAMTLTISCHKMVITRLSSQWHRFTPTVSTLYVMSCPDAKMTLQQFSATIVMLLWRWDEWK